VVHTIASLRLRSRIHVVFVKIVAFKEFLHGVSTQLQLTLFDCFCVFPLLIVNVVRVEVVYSDVWDVLRMHLTRVEQIPVQHLEPRMRFQLVDSAFGANAILGLSLKTLVDKVGGLN
jgi:hypothetical protein